nr:jacalin-like lectin [Streptomyces sp. SID8352]
MPDRRERPPPATAVRRAFARVLRTGSRTGTLETGAKHGGDGGTEQRIDLQAGEHIVRVFGRSDKVVDQIGFETNLSVYGPFGGSGGDPFEFKLPIGAFVAGFHGSAAKLLDALGVLYYQDASQ